MNIKPVLKDNDWSTIIEVANRREGQNYWNIGDEIDIILSGKYCETVTLQIWDFNHFDKSDNTGKANILFGMKDLMRHTMKMNLEFNTNKGGWNDSYMRNTVMKNIYESIPEHIRNYIKEVNTYANKGDYNTSSSQGLLSKDKVFLPGLTECNDNWSSQNQTETGQRLFPIFSNDSSRIKRLGNGSGPAQFWWTRSPYYSYSNNFCGFYDSGLTGSSHYASIGSGVCFCFNI